MAALVRQVQGKIFQGKFDDLDGWTEERTWPVSWNPSIALSSAAFYSSPYSLNAYIVGDYNNLVFQNNYLRRYTSVTIPAGVTTVRCQARHRWAGSATYANVMREITLGSQTILYQACTDAKDTWFLRNLDVATGPGSQTLKAGIRAATEFSGSYGLWQAHYFDDITIARSSDILVHGLETGWEVRLYDASDVLIVGATESGGTVTLDVSSNAYPITGRFKVYDAGDVLQFTSSLSTDIFGGDEYTYASGEYPITVSTDYARINRSGMDEPTEADLIFTLKDPLGNPVVGATINFTTTHGDLDVSSDVTDSAGNAHVSISGATAGVAIVKGTYAGDPDNGIPSSFNVIEIAIVGQTTVAVAAEGYDVWIQGVYIHHLLSVRLFSDEDRVEIEIGDVGTDLEVDVAYGQEIVVYQDASLIFTGRIEVIGKALQPESVTKVSGRSYIQHLMRIYVASATFTEETLKAIVEEIYTTYIDPLKQVSLGDIADSLAEISATIEQTETTVYDLLKAVADLGGVALSVDENRKMHLK